MKPPPQKREVMPTSQKGGRRGEGGSDQPDKSSKVERGPVSTRLVHHRGRQHPIQPTPWEKEKSGGNRWIDRFALAGS